MNPADVAQSVLPLTSSDLSLFTLFWNAHWVVKTVMVGLLVCSVWVWAIAIDKTVLYTRTRRAMDRFEQAFWSGQSLDEAQFRRQQHTQLRRAADAHRKGHGSDHCARDRAA